VDKRKSLSRVEFFTALIHLAVARHVLGGGEASVCGALRRLIHADIWMHMSPSTCAAIADPNGFRRHRCYTEAVDAVLRTHEATLRLLFNGLNQADLGASAQLLSLFEWMTFLRALGLIQKDLTDRDALLSFAWSRMLVIDGATDHGAQKETNLPFEGFLEALCRISVLKALPTDEERAARAVQLGADCPDAPSYISSLRIEDELAYDAWLGANAIEWGGEPRQPLDRCLVQLLALIVHTMRQSSGINEAKRAVASSGTSAKDRQDQPPLKGPPATQQQRSQQQRSQQQRSQQQRSQQQWSQQPQQPPQPQQARGGGIGHASSTSPPPSRSSGISAAAVARWFAENERKLGLLSVANTTRSSV